MLRDVGLGRVCALTSCNTACVTYIYDVTLGIPIHFLELVTFFFLHRIGFSKYSYLNF